MISIIIKLVASITLMVIIYQDNKDREFWLFLLPLFGISGGSLFYMQTQHVNFIQDVIQNSIIVSFIVGLIFLYSKFIMKRKLLSVLALGDILFFLMFSLSFPTLSFINLFTFSILFAIAFHFLKINLTNSYSNEIPLASYMSIFILVIYACHWLGMYHDLYTI